MEEKVTDLANYLKNNFFKIIILTVLLCPTIWWICTILNASKIDALNMKIEYLNSNIEVLKEQNALLQLKSEGYKDLVVQDDNKRTDWSTIKSN